MKIFSLKNIIIAIVIAIGLFVYNKWANPKVNFTNNVASGIQFKRNNWVSILLEAKNNNKLIFVDVYATWCGPCKRLKNSTFASSNVGNFFNKNFINTAFDAELGEGIAIAKTFNVAQYPTMLVVNGNGEVVGKTTGFLNEQALITFGENILKVQ